MTNTSGMILCFQSNRKIKIIAEITGIKKKNSTKPISKKYKIFSEKPLLKISQKNPKKTTPEKISTTKYCTGIFSLHFLHFPKSPNHEKIGTSSIGLRTCLHFGQAERLFILFQKLNIPSFFLSSFVLKTSGPNSYDITFKKDPKIVPRKKIKKTVVKNNASMIYLL
jgi:hypothetical protein